MAVRPGLGELDTAVALDGATIGEGSRAEAPPIERGRTIGRYVVLDRIGCGGMGVVYSAYDPELDRKLALKVLLPALPGRSGSEGHGGRLLREAQAMAKLSHPNVVTVHDVTNEDGRICIAMEFVEGGSLRAWLDEAPRGWREVLAMFEGAARGLAAAHAQGIVHRDFKPDNVMVDLQGRARVMDFGLARFAGGTPVREPVDEATTPGVLTSKDVKLTHVGAVIGTPAYMAPEQFLGEATDGRTDQFGFCVALWEGLYGTRPHKGTTFNELMLAITSGEVQAPPARSEVPGWVRSVVARGLRLAPSERWPTMEALLDALGRDPTRWRRRAAVVGGIGLVALGGLGLHAWSRRSTAAECERESHAIERAWNDTRAAAIETAFEATQVVHASTTFTKTRPWLDAWVQRFVATHEAACRATHLDGRRSPALHALTQQCLRDRELALAVLLESFEQPTGGVVSSAVDAVAALPELAPCMDDAWLERQPVRPEDPEDAAKALEAQRLLARGGVQYSDADYVQAAALGQAALASLETLPGRPFEAHARALVGLSLFNTGRDEDALPELEAAYLAGMRRRDLEPATDAAVAMARVLGPHLRRHEEALHWMRLADMTAELTGDAAFRQAEREETRADVLLDRGDYDQAIAGFEAALRVRLEQLGEPHPYVAASRSALAQAYLRLGRYDEAEGEARAAVQTLEESLGFMHPNTARGRLNLAGVLQARHELAAAEAEIRACLEVFAVTVIPEDPVLAVTHNNLAGVLQEQGKLEEALVELREAARLLPLALGKDHPNAALLHGNIAALLGELGREEEAEVAGREAVRAFEVTTSAEHPQAAQLRINLAEQLTQAGKLEQAEAVLREGMSTTQAAVGADDPRTAMYGHALAVVLVKAGREDEARERLEAAWAIREKAAVEPLFRAQTAWSLAKVLTGDPERARSLALTARELFAGIEQREAVESIDAWLAARP